MKPIILTLVSGYLPGFKYGGPIRTIVNMVETLGEEFEFRIITTDKDLGESEPYPGVQLNSFNKVGKAMVYYATNDMLSYRKLCNLIRSIPYHVLYLNSFFNPNFTIRPLILRRFGKLPDKPVIVAPRGEFSEGALRLKRCKKRAFITFAKALKLYEGVIWQASSKVEEKDIGKWFRKNTRVYIAPDLTDMNSKSMNYQLVNKHRKKEKDFLKIIFLSRISPMKNLDGALYILKNTKSCIEFNIYGPITDQAYWAKCQDIIKQMPSNVKVSYMGSIPPEKVPNTMADHDLFFLPTHGENFGHVIFEALSVGTPVLISDQTPWRNLEAYQAGWDFPLDQKEQFTKTIDLCCSLTTEDYSPYNTGAYKYALNVVESNNAVEANRQLFLEAIKEGRYTGPHLES